MAKSLCFLEAYRAKREGKIDEAEYMHHLLLHCLGEEEHEGDWSEDNELQETDLFGYSIQVWALKMNGSTMARAKDIKPFEDVFNAFRTAGVDEIKTTLEKLPLETQPWVLQSLAIRCLQKKKADVLKFCLDNGFNYHDFWIDAAKDFKKTEGCSRKHLETWNVLEASEFRKLWPRSTPRYPHPLW